MNRNHRLLGERLGEGGSRDSSSGFRFPSFGFRVSVPGLRFRGFGLRVSGFGVESDAHRDDRLLGEWLGGRGGDRLCKQEQLR